MPIVQNNIIPTKHTFQLWTVKNISNYNNDQKYVQKDVCILQQGKKASTIIMEHTIHFSLSLL
jgi:hypothetical protein